MSSLVIVAAAVFEISCGKSDSHNNAAKNSTLRDYRRRGLLFGSKLGKYWIYFTARLAVFMRSAIPPLKVNRFRLCLEHFLYIVGGWSW